MIFDPSSGTFVPSAAAAAQIQSSRGSNVASSPPTGDKADLTAATQLLAAQQKQLELQQQLLAAQQALLTQQQRLTPAELGARLLLGFQTCARGRFAHLFVAAKNNDLAGVQKWLAQGAPVAYADSDQYASTPVHWAAFNNCVPTLSVSFRLGISVVTLGRQAMVQSDRSALLVRSKYMFTPLHSAAWNKSEDAARYLLSQGASKTAVDVWKRTPRQVAEAEKAPSKLRSLLK